MRIDLRFQRFQFRVARQYAGFHYPRFRVAGGLHRDHHIIKSDGQKIEQQAGAENQGNFRAKALAQASEHGRLGQPVRQTLSGERPDDAGDQRGHDVRAQQAAQAVFFRQIPPAGIPGGKTNECVENAQRYGEHQRVANGDVVRDGQQVGQQQRDEDPHQQVNEQASEFGENRMHGWLVLHDHAAENGDAFDYQFLLLSRIPRRKLARFVGVAAENADAVHRDQPVFRNFDFATAHHGDGFDHRSFTGQDVRFAQVDLISPAERDQFAAAKVLSGNPLVEAAENGHVIQLGIFVAGAAPRVDVIHPLRIAAAIRAGATPAHRLVDHRDADADHRQGPDALKSEMADAEVAEQQQNAPAQHDETPQAASAASAATRQGHDAAGDEHRRPKIIEDPVGGQDALLIE